MKKLFGTDGIRGVANRYPIEPEFGVRLGRAVVDFCKGQDQRPSLVIGRDTRISGEMLEHSVIAGVLSAGGRVYKAGVLPTPGIAYLTRACGAAAGLVISASHNPYEYNGFKIFSNTGHKLSNRLESDIEKSILSPSACKLSAKNRDVGETKSLQDAEERYIGFLNSTLPVSFCGRNLHTVLDCANGAAYRVAPVLFQKLGVRFSTLSVTPDGRNINRSCGSEHPEQLCETVIREGADAGLAFDGDADRLVAVDEKGQILSGDQIMTVCAKMLKENDELENNLVVSTVMSNIGLGLALERLGIQHAAASVGDRHVMEAMLKRGAILGGEESGHIIFRQHHTTGDGLLSALQLLRAMRTFQQPLSELSEFMTRYPQTLVNVPVKSRYEIANIPEVAEVIAKVEDKLGRRGRVLVRYSGTEPLCRVMVEGEDRSAIEKYAAEIAEIIEEKLGPGGGSSTLNL
jgi:phosphoglucosamine mutase